MNAASSSSPGNDRNTLVPSPGIDSICEPAAVRVHDAARHEQAESERARRGPRREVRLAHLLAVRFGHADAVVVDGKHRAHRGRRGASAHEATTRPGAP